MALAAQVSRPRHRGPMTCCYMERKVNTLGDACGAARFAAMGFTLRRGQRHDTVLLTGRRVAVAVTILAIAGVFAAGGGEI